MTLQDARDASEYLQRDPPGFPEKHLKAVLTALDEVRRRRHDAARGGAISSPQWREGEEQSARESADCPECYATGWARRRLVWPSLAPVWVRLYCRCSYGFWRESYRGPDPDGDNYESLQSQPYVWDQGLTHWTWSSAPTRPLIVLPEGVRYLRPDDPTSAATPRETLADRLRARRKAGAPAPTLTPAFSSETEMG